MLNKNRIGLLLIQQYFFSIFEDRKLLPNMASCRVFYPSAKEYEDDLQNRSKKLRFEK